MTDNIISFPLHKKNIPISPEMLNQWRTGLYSSSYEEQWRTFEQMTSFSDIHVIHLAQEYLNLHTGEPFLKTKLLQVLKNTCPSSLAFQVEKHKQGKQITLEQVPIQFDHWEPELLVPIQILQDKAYADPSLVEMAKELWIYFLEKYYPFNPVIEEDIIWTAGLHFYTLTVINEELANIQLEEKLPNLYGLPKEVLLQQYQRFEALLKQM